MPFKEKPEDVLREVTKEIISRAIKLGKKRGRTISISRTSKGKGICVTELDPNRKEGQANLEKFFSIPARHYTISGLGAPEDSNSINWRVLNAPFLRRVKLLLMVAVSFVLKGCPFKNKFYRWMGVHIGKNVEIMQLVWLDHFRPELIFIDDNSLLGAFTRVTVHGYEGQGKFRYGLVEIGKNCTIGAGTGLGVIKIEDNVRTLPGTLVSPYYPRLRSGTVVGYNAPPKTKEKKRKLEE